MGGDAGGLRPLLGRSGRLRDPAALREARLPGPRHRESLDAEIERLATDAHKLYVCTMLRTSRNTTLFLSLGYRPESVLPDHYHHTDFICFSKYLKPVS